MKNSVVLLIGLFFLSSCAGNSTRLVAINTKQPRIDGALLGECRKAAPIPPKANSRQIANVMLHDRSALDACRKDKAALNQAVRGALR